jgi:hypothetical protein
MRKARIASKLDEAKPLPLWCVKLDGFVVDQLPFEHELSKVVLLTCGENCIDAGLRAPRTPRAYTMNKWGPSVNNEATHCLIVFPNWAAIFDNEGRLLDPSGNVVSSDDGDTSPPPLEPVPLTAEPLNLKNLTEALESMKRRDSKTSTLSSYPTSPTTIDAESTAPMAAESLITTFGSAIPTPRLDSVVSQLVKDDVLEAEVCRLHIPTNINDNLRPEGLELKATSSLETSDGTSSRVSTTGSKNSKLGDTTR